MDARFAKGIPWYLRPRVIAITRACSSSYEMKRRKPPVKRPSMKTSEYEDYTEGAIFT